MAITGATRKMGCWERFKASKHFEPLMVSFLCFGFFSFLSVYMLYYMKVFLDEYHISTEAVRVVQALFLAWNAINDPLMGYLQDIGCCGMTWIMDRRKVILYCGPVFALSFLMFWFPWSTTNTVVVAIHLLVTLYLFDTIFTLVLSAYCGLLVEACEDHEQRVRCLVYAELFGILGGSLIFPLNIFSQESKNFTKFQIGCVMIAILGAISMAGGAYFLKPRKKKHQDIQEEIRLSREEDFPVEVEENAFKKAMRVSWQIVRGPRFVFLIFYQFLRFMRIYGADAFLIILVQSLVSRPGFLETGSPALSAFYAASRPIGSILFMILYKPIAVLGSHRMLFILHTVALINIVMALILGRENPMATVVYMGIEVVIASIGVHSFTMLLTGEVVDTDAKRHHRSSPLTTLIFTLKALFTKPAEQLAPLIFITLLERGGFTAHRAECILTADTVSNSTMIANQSMDLMNGTSIMEASVVRVEEPQCTILLDTMHSSMVYFTFVCTLGELIFVAADYWYKRRVLHEADKGANVMAIPLSEEEAIKMKS